MLYQLSNGKCIELSLEQYLIMSDEELNNFLAMNVGDQIEDPFAISVLKYGQYEEDEDYYIEDEEYIEDLLDLDIEEKLTDTDFINLDELEI